VRCTAVLGTLLVSAACLSGCGGSAGNAGGASNGAGSKEVVARVGSIATIDSATLNRWMPIEARIIYSEKPKGPAPAGVMPDPPDYSACIAFLTAYLHGDYAQIHSPTGVGGESSAELKRKCEHQYTELKAITLNTLIGWYWIIGQGMEAGISVTPQQVKERLTTVNKRLFASSADFANYLRWTDETTEDMLFRSRVQLFESEIHDKTLAAAKAASKITDVKQREVALAKISSELSPAQRWVQKTTCAPAYVVSSCKEYKGTLAPGLPD
jgi:hypothetical protein